MPDTAAASSPDARPSPATAAAALWRPSAVAVWSLVFTPVFGSYLLMRNWQALGHQRAAGAARRSLFASLGVLALELFAGAINRRLNGGSPWSSGWRWPGSACGCWRPQRRNGSWCGAASAAPMRGAAGTGCWPRRSP